MKHPKFLVEVLTKTSMRFLEKNAPGVEVLTRTYLRSLVRTYFMKQGSGGYIFLFLPWRFSEHLLNEAIPTL